MASAWMSSLPLAYPCVMARATIQERFWVKVNRDGPIPAHRPDLGPCWVWTQGRHSAGYGQFYPRHGKPTGAHRVAYELLIGPIPDLEPVTHAENLRRGVGGAVTHQRAKTHCPYGHAYDDANTRINNRGSRECRRCLRDHKRRRYLQRVRTA